MLTTATSLIPVFAMIMLGYGLRRFDLVPTKLWLLAEKLTYFVLLPSLIFHKLAASNLHELNAGSMVAVLAGGVLVMTILLVLLRRPLGRIGRFEGPGFTSVYQGAVRSNFFISLVAIDAVLGPEGTLRGIVGFAVLPPLANVLSIFVLARFAADKPASPKKMLAVLAKNPFVYAALSALAFNFAGVGNPPILGPATGFFSTFALPVALVCIGSSLEFTNLRTGGRAVFMSVALKLIAMPLVVYLLCRAIGMDAFGTAVAVAFHAPPAGSACYVFARNMGGDYVMMASILTMQTAFAAATIPLVLYLVAP